MTILEWLAFYKKKTGESFQGWPGADFIFDAERGFCVSIKDDDVLIIGEVCGDGRHWVDWLTMMAKQQGCTKLRFWTKRNPAAFSRKFGFMLTGFSDGHYIMEREVFFHERN